MSYTSIYIRAKEQGGAARFETVIQGLKSDFAEATQALVGHAKSSTGATDGGLLKLVYIAEQMQVIQGIVERLTNDRLTDVLRYI